MDTDLISAVCGRQQSLIDQMVTCEEVVLDYYGRVSARFPASRMF